MASTVHILYFSIELIIIILFVSLCSNEVFGYSNPNYPHIGRQCPCFCSVRSGDGASPYWDDVFGAEVGSAKCNTTSCLEASEYREYMPFCREVISYKFCPRQFDHKYLNLKGTALLLSLDTHAKNCHEASMADPDKLLRKGSEEIHAKCSTNVRKGSCFTVFPRCTKNLVDTGEVKPLGICTSFCKHERESCRADNVSGVSIDLLLRFHLTNFYSNMIRSHLSGISVQYQKVVANRLGL